MSRLLLSTGWFWFCEDCGQGFKDQKNCDCIDEKGLCSDCYDAYVGEKDAICEELSKSGKTAF